LFSSFSELHVLQLSNFSSYFNNMMKRNFPVWSRNNIPQWTVRNRNLRKLACWNFDCYKQIFHICFKQNDIWKFTLVPYHKTILIKKIEVTYSVIYWTSVS
jgi:hypothetical protein